MTQIFAKQFKTGLIGGGIYMGSMYITCIQVIRDSLHAHTTFWPLLNVKFYQIYRLNMVRACTRTDWTDLGICMYLRGCTACSLYSLECTNVPGFSAQTWSPIHHPLKQFISDGDKNFVWKNAKISILATEQGPIL